MNSLQPWAIGPFELILHAEGHLRNGDDFDRRIALISFDNSIEVSISTYLSLNPMFRGNRNYDKKDVEKWLHDYHTKLDFFNDELQKRNSGWKVDRRHIIWAHNHRNEQYHGGSKGTPEKHVISLIRDAALWIFSVLYDVPNVEEILEGTITASLPKPSPQPDTAYDRAIDHYFGMVEVAGQIYNTSEVLFAADDIAYREIGTRLCNKLADGKMLNPKEKHG
jgi:hypothetical protein